jgi:hypothetical protein
MTSSRIRRLLLALAVAGATLTSALASVQSSAAPHRAGFVLPPRIIDRGLEAQGVRVRQTGTVTVDRIPLDEDLARLLDEDERVYRVRVAGHYRPRALRYVVRAGGRPVAFGIPRSERAIVAVTSDPAVLKSPITVRYESSRLGPAIQPSTEPAPLGTGGLGPAAPGPLAVTRTEYDFGDRAYQPAGLPGRVELRADVHYPTSLSSPYPLVLFLHGNHSSCYHRRRSDFRWPCREGWKPIPNYEGYDYIARRLASYGFIVVSVSGNGVNVIGSRLADTGMRQRGLLLEKHLDLWNAWNTTGGDPFGTTFVGKVDMSRIGVMGHSRGGEGAVWHVIVDRERAVPYGIDAVLPLAPVDFDRETVNEVPMGVILPYCDGDVSDLQGVHFFDDARYRVPGDTSPKSTVTVFGANHNFFNTVWSPSSGIPGAFDDGYNCRGRLTEKQQRRVGIAYMVGFFRHYVGGSPEGGTDWSGETTPDIAPATTAVTYQAPDTPTTRLDVDRFDSPDDLVRTQSGGEVIPTRMGLFGWCNNMFETPCQPGIGVYYDIHVSFSYFAPPPEGLQEGVLGWSQASEGQASVRFELPPGGRNASSMDFLVFRTAPNVGYDVNRGIQYQDLSVILEDANGSRAEIAAADVGNDVLAYPISRRGGHVIMNQIRFPLSAFGALDLSSIAAVELAFNRTEQGVINVSDLAFMQGVG